MGGMPGGAAVEVEVEAGGGGWLARLPSTASPQQQQQQQQQQQTAAAAAAAAAQPSELRGRRSCCPFDKLPDLVVLVPLLVDLFALPSAIKGVHLTCGVLRR